MSESKPRIVVVDDNEVKRYTITRTLRSAGFDVVEGAVGADALRLAPAASLLVLDIKLPDINGFEICRRLKANPATASLPVLLVSATFVGPDSQVQGLDSGADAYLTDATEPPVLVATVRALLRMRRAEERAREGEAWYRALVEQVKDYAIFRTNLAGVATTWNEGVRRVLGYSEPEFLGLDCRRLFTPEDVAAGVPEQELREAEETGTGDDDRWMIRRDGGRFWASGTTSALRDHAGRLIGYTKVMRDLTVQKAAEQALRDADQKKDEFLALLAHELRNPLAPIRTALAIQQQPGADAEALARARDMMARQIANMVRLIDDLLDVSRVSKGKIELRKSRVELAEVLGTAVETSRPLIEAAGHELTLGLPGKPVWLEVDPTRIGQVVSNLLNNAAKFTPEGGRIRLTAAVERGEAVVRVADNGSGIAPDVLPRMWEMFAQADRTIGRSQGGLGIGLTLVRRLVEMHGGTVQAHSDGPGRGSEFTIRLPVVVEVGPQAPPPTSPAPAEVAPHRILVVDDNVDGAESLATLLELYGHEVRTALDGPAALAVADEFRPDVVLLDIGLPGMDGYEVARQLRAREAFRAARLIAMTGWGQDADRERSRQAGFDLHLVKPVDPAELRRVLGAPPAP
jgi:PAS domain S-box-containing protein